MAKAFRGLSIIVLSIIIHANNLVAQGEEQLGAPHAGQEFQPVIGQGTNRVSAREVRWTGSYGLEGRTYVFLAKGSKHAITAPSTNQVCFLKGRLFAVGIGIQSLSLLTSRPVAATELTTEVATSLLENVRRTSPRRKEVDLRPLLKSELERHLAQPLILRSAQLRTENERLVVDFESCTLLKGEVVLDEELNVISMKLSDNAGHE